MRESLILTNRIKDHTVFIDIISFYYREYKYLQRDKTIKSGSGNKIIF